MSLRVIFTTFSGGKIVSRTYMFQTCSRYTFVPSLRCGKKAFELTISTKQKHNVTSSDFHDLFGRKSCIENSGCSKTLLIYEVLYHDEDLLALSFRMCVRNLVYWDHLNLSERPESHDAGNYKNSYSKRWPVRLVFQCEFTDPNIAIDTEKQVKKRFQSKKQDLIAREALPIWPRNNFPSNRIGAEHA